MRTSITIWDFDRLYRTQTFYEGKEYSWLDLTDLSGVNGLCDGASFEELRCRMHKGYQGIHAIGGGNYHYVSYLYLDRIRCPFSLVLFDHHTDMKPPAFGELLSCGCWVKRALDDLAYLTEVVMIGVDEGLTKTIGSEYENRVRVYGTERICQNRRWMEEAAESIRSPFYLSVDLDVFSTEETGTDWDQGVMTWEQFACAFGRFREGRELLGADLCGGESLHSERFLEHQRLNDRMYGRLLDLLDQHG